MDNLNLVKTVAEVFLPFVVLYYALITEVIEPVAVQGFYCSDKSLGLPYKEGSISNNAVYATGGLPLVFVSLEVLYFAVDLEVTEPFIIRGFFCGEQRLSYPYTDSTVPNSLIYGTGTLPLIFVIVTAYNVIPLKKLYRVWVSYAFGISSVYLFMNIMKLFYGELRPNFFEACKPVWPGMNCSGYVSEFNCTGTNRKAAIESMRSFPSSHAGITAFGMLYLIIFTQEVFINRNNRYHIGWATFQWVGFLWAVYAGMSRITDNKHHIQDVAAGFFIGSTTSYWVAYQWSGLGEIGNPKIENDGKSKNHVITHCSCQNGISVGKPKES